MNSASYSNNHWQVDTTFPSLALGVHNISVSYIYDGLNFYTEGKVWVHNLESSTELTIGVVADEHPYWILHPERQENDRRLEAFGYK